MNYMHIFRFDYLKVINIKKLYKYLSIFNLPMQRKHVTDNLYLFRSEGERDDARKAYDVFCRLAIVLEAEGFKPIRFEQSRNADSYRRTTFPVGQFSIVDPKLERANHALHVVQTLTSQAVFFGADELDMDTNTGLYQMKKTDIGDVVSTYKQLHPYHTPDYVIIRGTLFGNPGIVRVNYGNPPPKQKPRLLHHIMPDHVDIC
jgi:hypothetical protein